MRNVSRVKCIVAGESTVGKTAVTQAFSSNGITFPKNYLMTLGVDICNKTVSVSNTCESVEFFLFDSSGKDIYVDSLVKYWENPDLIILVYDVTNENTLHQCEKWMKIVQPLFTASPLSGILLANKIDEADRRAVSSEDGEKFAQKHGLHYYECSAKQGKGIDEAFAILADLWLKITEEKSSTTISA